MNPVNARALALGIALLAASGLSCREGTSQAGSQFNPIVPPIPAIQGCAGDPDMGMATPLTQVDLLNGDALGGRIGPQSKMVGVAGTDTFYLSAGDNSIWLVDLSTGLPPVMTELVDNTTIDNLVQGAGVTPPITADAVISGMGILDGANLVVVEQTSNTLLAVSRVTPNTVSFLSGFPTESGGNSDGPGSLTRFNLSSVTEVLVSGAGGVYLADPGNHSIRLIAPVGIPESATLAGLGAPLYNDGTLPATGFDTPTGLTVTCAGELIVTETGDSSIGGHRIRRLMVGDPAFFGGFDGSSDTLIGNGVDMTLDGIGTAASTARPVAPLATSQDILYWVDSSSGLLRSADLLTLQTTTLAGTMSPGGEYSLTITASDQLFCLDSMGGMLYRVIP